MPAEAKAGVGLRPPPPRVLPLSTRWPDAPAAPVFGGAWRPSRPPGP